MRIVQRDAVEYARFLLSKYSKVFDDYDADLHEVLRKSKSKETDVSKIRGSIIEVDRDSDIVYPKPPVDTFSDMLRGREDLSIDENRILDLYRTIDNEEKNSVYKTLIQERKKHPSKKTKAIREAARKAIAEGKPIPPLSEIYPEE